MILNGELPLPVARHAVRGGDGHPDKRTVCLTVIGIWVALGGIRGLGGCACCGLKPKAAEPSCSKVSRRERGGRSSSSVEPSGLTRDLVPWCLLLLTGAIREAPADGAEAAPCECMNI